MEAVDENMEQIDVELFRAKRELRNVQRKIKEMEAASAQMASRRQLQNKPWWSSSFVVICVVIAVLNASRFFNLYSVIVNGGAKAP